MPSWQSRAVQAYLRLQRDPPDEAAARVHARVARRTRRPHPAQPPWWLRRRVAVMTSDGPDGWPVHRVLPHGPTPDRHVVYVHGGAYTGELDDWHWRLIGHLTRAAPAVVHVPVYPLAPGATAATTVPEVARAVRAVLDEAGTGSVSVAGDSAGAGLALASAMVLRDEGGPLPRRLVLVSPWLDVTAGDPRQPVLSAVDAMLTLPGLLESGRLYAGSLDPTDWRVSPLWGEATGLPPTTVYAGTLDLLFPDALRWRDRARAAGVAVDLRTGPGMPHDWPLIPVMPEGRAARAEIVDLVRT